MKKEVLPARNYRLECLAVVSAFVALGCMGLSPTRESVELAPVGDETWAAQVDEAATIWNDALDCYPSFEVARNAGLPVVLYPEASWPGASNERGYYDETGIAVRTTTLEIERATLVHEMGHALGLQHSDDKTSVMYPIVSVTYQPNATDIELAKDALGCP